MPEIADYAAFVAIAEHGSLTAAARHLGRPLQAVSRSLIALERELGVALVQRTTRRSRPTEAGRAYLARVRPALAELAAAEAVAAETRERIAGRIRMSGPPMFGSAVLIDLVAGFMRRHPEVEVELVLGEAYVDLIDGFDLAVRFGEMPDSALRSRRIGTLRQIAFGAPAYFAEAGWPVVPQDLARHRCILRTSARTPGTWPFVRDDHEVQVTVAGPFRSDAPAACNAAAIAGLGIACAPLWQVRDAVAAGRLAPILTDWGQPTMPMHLVWPPAALPARVRLLIDHIAGHIDPTRI